MSGIASRVGLGIICRGQRSLLDGAVLRRPRNYPSGPTETRWTGTLRGAFLTAVAGEYNYSLLQRALPEVRDLLCALSRNDLLREARNGKVLGRTPTFDQDGGSENFHAGRARFLVEKEKTGQVRREGRARRRESGLQVPGSLLWQGGAVSGAGRVGCLLTTDN